MLKDFIQTFSGRAGRTAIGFVNLLILLRLMSKQDYGLLTLALSVGGVTAVFAQFGLTSGVSKLINDAQVRQPASVARVFRNALRLQYVLLLGVTLVGVGLAAFVYADTLWPRGGVLAGVALFVAGTVASEHFQRTARTFDQFGAIANMTLVLALVRLLGLVVPYWLTRSMDLSVFVFGLTYAGAAGVYLHYLVRLAERFSADAVQQAARKEEVSTRRYLSVALPFLVIASSNVIFSQIAQLVLGKVRSLEALANFEIANRAVNVLRAPAIAFSFVVSSRFGRAVVRQDRRDIARKLDYTAQMSMLGVPLAALLFFNADWVTYTLGGEKYASAVGLVQWLALYLVAVFPSDSFSLSMDYSGMARQRAVVVAAVAVLNVVLCAVLIPRHGGFGAAAALVVATAVQTVLFMVLVRQEFTFNMLGSLRPFALPGLLLVAVVGIRMWEVGHLSPLSYRIAGTAAAVAMLAPWIRLLKVEHQET